MVNGLALVLVCNCALTAEDRRALVVKVVQEQIDVIENEVRLLGKIANASDFARVKADLIECDKKLALCTRRLREMKATVQELDTAISQLLSGPPKRDLGDEYGRLLKFPPVCEELAKLESIANIIDLMRADAICYLRIANESLDEFVARHGKYPKRLEELRHMPKYRTSEEIEAGPYLDPWGRPYRYDPVGTKNGGKRPDVWSEGPPHRCKQAGPIGNWMEEVRRVAK
jgi:hypothetical protein